MKIILASILAVLAPGIVRASSDVRALQGDDRYAIVEQLKVALALDNTAFAFTSKHNEADSTGTTWKGTRYMYLFKKCPHGLGPDLASGAVADDDNNFLGEVKVETDSTTPQPGWFQTETAIATAGSGDQFTSTMVFKILPTVSAEKDIYVGTDNAQPLKDEGKVSFCLFYGIGNDKTATTPAGTVEEVYGFREIILTATFTFDGGFKCTSFETQAYNPTDGQVTTTKEYTAIAANCSPLDPVRPGSPVCIEICLDDDENTVYVDSINTMNICEDGTSTTAPDKTDIVPGYPTLWSYCDASNNEIGDGDLDALEMKTRSVGSGCCRAMFILPARYFPTAEVSDPTVSIGVTGKANFKVCGNVELLPLPVAPGPDVPCGSIPPGETCSSTTHCMNKQNPKTCVAGDCNYNNNLGQCKKKAPYCAWTPQDEKGVGQGTCSVASVAKRRLSVGALQAFEGSRSLQEDVEINEQADFDAQEISIPIQYDEESSSAKIGAAAAAAAAFGAALLI